MSAYVHSTGIVQNIVQSTGNSSTSNLSASASFTGTAVSTLNISAIQVSLKTDQDCTVFVQQSPDGTNWDISDSFTYINTQNNFGITVQAVNSYARLVVTNLSSTTATTFFRLQTVLTPIIEAVPRALDSIGNLKVSAYDINLLMSRSLVPNHIAINKFGRNSDIDIGTEDIWSQGGTWVQPTAARIHAIVSTSVNDTAAGTGARTVTVNGLNGSYVDTTETIIMNGTTPVNTVNSYWIIHRMIVATAGGTATATGTNEGTITATAATDATVSAAIIIGKGQSQLCIYQVPAGYSAYLKKYVASYNGAQNSNVDVELFAKPFGGTFNLKGTIVLGHEGSSFGERIYDTPLKFAAKTIIKLRATSDAANSNVTGSFDLILILD